MNVLEFIDTALDNGLMCKAVFRNKGIETAYIKSKNSIMMKVIKENPESLNYVSIIIPHEINEAIARGLLKDVVMLNNCLYADLDKRKKKAAKLMVEDLSLAIYNAADKERLELLDTIHYSFIRTEIVDPATRDYHRWPGRHFKNRFYTDIFIAHDKNYPAMQRDKNYFVYELTNYLNKLNEIKSAIKQCEIKNIGIEEETDENFETD